MRVAGYSTYVRGGADEYAIGPPELFYRTPFAATCDPLALPGMEVAAFEGEYAGEVRIGKLTLLKLNGVIPLGVMLSARSLSKHGVTDPINQMAIYASSRGFVPKRSRPDSLPALYLAARKSWRRIRQTPVYRPTLYRDITCTADDMRDRWYGRWVVSPETVDWALAVEGANARWLGVNDRGIAAVLSLGPVLRHREAPYGALQINPETRLAARIERLHAALLGLDKDETRAAVNVGERLRLSAISGEDAWKYTQLVGLDPFARWRAARDAERELTKQAALDYKNVRLSRGK